MARALALILLVIVFLSACASRDVKQDSVTIFKSPT
jgi:hypothetical protein